MQATARISIYSLLSGVLLATSGCVVAHRDYDRGYDHDRAYYQRDDRDRDAYRDHDRREAYERCRAEGGRDCDDILHR